METKLIALINYCHVGKPITTASKKLPDKGVAGMAGDHDACLLTKFQIS